MTTYHIKIEIDQYVEDDKGFYTVFGDRRIVSGTSEIKEMLKKMLSDAFYYIDERLNENGNRL